MYSIVTRRRRCSPSWCCCCWWVRLRKVTRTNRIWRILAPHNRWITQACVRFMEPFDYFGFIPCSEISFRRMRCDDVRTLASGDVILWRAIIKYTGRGRIRTDWTDARNPLTKPYSWTKYTHAVSGYLWQRAAMWHLYDKIYDRDLFNYLLTRSSVRSTSDDNHRLEW
jgi:hypothetical protein